MKLSKAVEVVHSHRPDSIVVSTMGPAREWCHLGLNDLDWVYLPSSMGQATSIGLGLALARPERQVIVLNGDGSMLMNLGSLVSVSLQEDANLIVIVFCNGIYEVTGGQATAANESERHKSKVNWTQMARGAGISTVYAPDSLNSWRDIWPHILKNHGVRFVHVPVEMIEGDPTPKSPGPAAERVKLLAEKLKQ